MTKQQFIDWALMRGWQLDQWGHLHKTINDRQHRFKLSNISVRYDIKMQLPPHNPWLRLSSGYLKDLAINAENKITGLRR